MIIKNENDKDNKKMIMTMSMSSIDIEAIRTVLFFLLKYFAKKNTQALFKYLNTPKKA